MARTMRREARQGMTLPWVVTYGGKFAGQLTVGGIVWGSARSAQVGYWVDEAFAGQGVIPTALAMAMDHCFFGVGLHRVEATIRPENAASRRVVEKLGFREEGHPAAQPAHRRRLARSRLLRAHRRGRARRPAGPLAQRRPGLPVPGRIVLTAAQRRPGG